MITESESSLTPQEYIDVQATTADLAVQIKLQRYGPVWTEHDTSPARTGSCFDAIVSGAFLVRAYAGDCSSLVAERLPDETAADQVWAAIGGSLSDLADIDEDVPISLIDDGAIVRLFYYSTGGKIRYSECADIAAGNPTFGAAQDVGTVANVIQLAATGVARVYYVTVNTNNNRRLHVYDYSGGAWSSSSSDIYWPFPIYAFDAGSLSDFTDGDLSTTDMLTMASELPPLLGSRAVGAEVVAEVNLVQGIVGFRVDNGRFSDHNLLDTVDRTETLCYRDNLRTSFVNGFMFAAYERSGGLGDYAYTKVAISRSKDGENWEFPEFVGGSLSDLGMVAPVVILPRTDYLYAVGLTKTARSPCCVWAGQVPVDLDVTSYVTAIESQAAEIRNSRVILSNPADVLGGTLAKSDDRIQVTHDLGYVVGGAPLRMTVSTEDVVSRNESEQLPQQGLALTSRDRLGRVNRVRSDYAAEWPGQQAGRDLYNDPSGTGYGGLRHTAPYEGSWKASGGICELLSSNKEGIAVSTFVASTLNGSAQTAFKLHTDSEGEYAGIAFRVFDKDNLYYAVYYLDDDVVKIRSKIGGDDTTLATSNAMTWVKDTWYWLRVITHYAIVHVYSSTDGKTWTELAWATGSNELDGVATSITMRLLAGQRLHTGKFGLIGYGYSAEDTWPDIPLPPPPPPPPLPPVPENAIIWSKNQLARTENFDDRYPTWVDIEPAAGATPIHRVVIDMDGRAAWMVTGAGGDADQGIWYTPDIMADPVDWTLKLDQVSAEALALAHKGSALDGWRYMSSPVSFGANSICVGERKWCGIWSRDASFFFTSSDRGDTWTTSWSVTGDKFWLHQYASVHGTQQMVFDGATIWVGGMRRDGVGGKAAFTTSTDGINWAAPTMATFYLNGFFTTGMAGNSVYVVTIDSKIVYKLPTFLQVDTGMKRQALGLYHPSSLFGVAVDPITGNGGFWLDGRVVEEEADIFPNATVKSLGGVAPWPVAGAKTALINAGATVDPEIVVWWENGFMYDKTGNLITAIGAWAGVTANRDNVGIVYVY